MKILIHGITQGLSIVFWILCGTGQSASIQYGEGKKDIKKRRKYAPTALFIGYGRIWGLISKSSKHVNQYNPSDGRIKHFKSEVTAVGACVVPTKTADSDGPRCMRFRVDFDKMSCLTRWVASNTPIVVYYPFPALHVMLEHVLLIKLR